MANAVFTPQFRVNFTAQNQWTVDAEGANGEEPTGESHVLSITGSSTTLSARFERDLVFVFRLIWTS